MSLIPSNKKRFPWKMDDVSHWFDTNAFFNDDFFSRKANLPALNLRENDTNFEIELAIPGFDKSEIEVSLQDKMLRVQAKRKKENSQETEEGYTHQEFSYNSFYRSLRVPTSVNTDKDVKAAYNNGVLTIALEKNTVALETSKKLIEVL